MRSSDIAARCREIALRVECSGEWGELAETLREAAAEVERLRISKSERKAVIDARDALHNNYGWCDKDVAIIDAMLKRLGGGE